MNEQLFDEPGILDEIADQFSRYVVTSDVNRDAAVLFAGVTWAQKVLFTVPRMLFTSDEAGQEETGKTTAMNVVAALSVNAEEADGSYAALRSALMAAADTPEDSLRLWTFDAIDATMFGESGQNKGTNATLIKLLEKGYKTGAHESISVRGVKRKIPLFYPVIMTGKGVTLRRDLRSRTIVERMETGTPPEYFDARVAEPDTRKMGEALGKEIRVHLKEIMEFRGDGIHPRLTKRRLEVWEPLFAVAWCLGEQRWLNRCRDAFEALALDSVNQALTLRQQTLKDAADVLSKITMRVVPNGANVGKQFAGGLALAAEIKRLKGYEEKSELAIAQAVAKHMQPAVPRQVRFGKEVISGYLAQDVRNAWEAARPEDQDDVVFPDEEVNPFAVKDS